MINACHHRRAVDLFGKSSNNQLRLVILIRSHFQSSPLKPTASSPTAATPTRKPCWERAVTLPSVLGSAGNRQTSTPRFVEFSISSHTTGRRSLKAHQDRSRLFGFRSDANKKNFVVTLAISATNLREYLDDSFNWRIPIFEWLNFNLCCDAVFADNRMIREITGSLYASKLEREIIATRGFRLQFASSMMMMITAAYKNC